MAQGGDWGAIVADMMGVQEPQGLLGIHTNMPGVIPPDIDAAALSGAPLPSGLSDEEKKRAIKLTSSTRNIAYASSDGNAPADVDRHGGFAGRFCNLHSLITTGGA